MPVLQILAFLEQLEIGDAELSVCLPKTLTVNVFGDTGLPQPSVESDKTRSLGGKFWVILVQPLQHLDDRLKGVHSQCMFLTVNQLRRR